VTNSGGTINITSITNNGTLTFARTADYTNTSIISGGGTIVKQGTNTTLKLVGSNSFTSGMQVWEGAVAFDDPASLGAGLFRVGRVATTGTLRFTGTSNSTVTNGIQIGFGAGPSPGGAILEASGAGAVTFSSIVAEAGAQAARTLTLSGTNAGSNTISGHIADNNTGAGALVSLVKDGSGTWILTGTNTYTGSTTVTNGTLRLNGAAGAGLTATTNVSVATNAVLLLSASDQVNNAATVTLSGGTIQRGSGVTETFGNLSLTAASFINFGTGTTNSLNFSNYTGGGHKLNVTNFLAGNILTFKTDLTMTISNTSLFGFDNGFNSAWNSGSSTFTITAIPEPSTYAAALGLAGLMLWTQRRRLHGLVGRRH
jgi:autotransporter-associated beta strand protein